MDQMNIRIPDRLQKLAGIKAGDMGMSKAKMVRVLVRAAVDGDLPESMIKGLALKQGEQKEHD